MSEYQYYEFRSIDRPLTEKEQAYIASLSRRVALTPNHAVFTYSFGDFPVGPIKILQQYFDAMLYLANWGTKQLAFRFPRAIVEPDMFAPYCFADVISASVSNDQVVLDISICEEETVYWVEGDGWLPTLALLRRDILRGDLRALYLVWLKAISVETSIEVAGETLEPPIPANLHDLSLPLKKLIELFEIDEDLIVVASEFSPEREDVPELTIEELIGKLSPRERDAFLIKVVKGEPNVDAQIIRRLREISLHNMQASELPASHRRTAAELLAGARERAERRAEKQRQEAERARVQRLNELSRKEPQLWDHIFALIEKKQAKAYDEAIKRLIEMRELAEYRNESERFRVQMARLREKYSNRPGLLSRLRGARLVTP